MISFVIGVKKWYERYNNAKRLCYNAKGLPKAYLFVFVIFGQNTQIFKLRMVLV